jgi:hypothetical protein
MVVARKYAASVGACVLLVGLTVLLTLLLISTIKQAYITAPATVDLMGLVNFIGLWVVTIIILSIVATLGIFAILKIVKRYPYYFFLYHLF